MRLRRAPPSERVALAREATSEATWEGRLVRAVAGADSSFEVGDTVNEAVNDLAASYSSRERWSAAALRIQVLGGVLMGAAGLIAGEHLAAGVALAVSFVGAGMLATLGRRAEVEEKERRRHVDSLVELLLDRPHEPDARPARRGQKSAASPAMSRRRG